MYAKCGKDKSDYSLSQLYVLRNVSFLMYIDFLEVLRTASVSETKEAVCQLQVKQEDMSLSKQSSAQLLC